MSKCTTRGTGKPRPCRWTSERRLVQGLGGALLEELAYDEQGQLLTGGFADYLMPTASDVPPIEVLHMETPSPLNAFGVKGLAKVALSRRPWLLPTRYAMHLDRLKRNSIQPQYVGKTLLPLRKTRIDSKICAQTQRHKYRTGQTPIETRLGSGVGS